MSNLLPTSHLAADSRMWISNVQSAANFTGLKCQSSSWYRAYSLAYIKVLAILDLELGKTWLQHCQSMVSAWSNDNLISVRMWGNEQTNRHTQNLKSFWTSVQISEEGLQKFEKDGYSRNGDIQMLLLFQWGSTATNRLTDLQDLFWTREQTSE